MIGSGSVVAQRTRSHCSSLDIPKGIFDCLASRLVAIVVDVTRGLQNINFRFYFCLFLNLSPWRSRCIFCHPIFSKELAKSEFSSNVFVPQDHSFVEIIIFELAVDRWYSTVHTRPASCDLAWATFCTSRISPHAIARNFSFSMMPLSVGTHNVLGTQ